MRHRITAALVLAVVMVGAAGAARRWALQSSGTVARLRGVSAVDERVAWASGSKGTVLRTVDGGRHWTAVHIPGAESLDFRDIEAFGAQVAYVLSIGAGEQSRIYKTTDGGVAWSLQFTNADPNAFYDAIAFWDERHGLAVGDPVDGRFTILRTSDGGSTWKAIPAADRPEALPGDGMFAASGTCVALRPPSYAWMATGGAARARVFRSSDAGLTWAVADTPIAAGSASSGIFSIAFRDPRNGVVVGGDYRKENEAGDQLALTTDGGKTWFAPAGRVRAFRSAVAFVPRPPGATELLAVGPSGTDRSTDGGASWSAAGDEGFHAVAAGRLASSAWAVGENGTIARWK